jgi:hypothetical protein
MCKGTTEAENKILLEWTQNAGGPPLGINFKGAGPLNERYFIIRSGSWSRPTAKLGRAW